MRLNNTSRYPTKEVRRLVRFAASARGFDTGDIFVSVKNSSRSYAGRAYDGVPGISTARFYVSEGVRYLVTLRIGKPEQFPRVCSYRGKTGGRWPQIECRDWRDALVMIAAHELQHIDQYRRRKSRSEIECEMTAAYAVREWRRTGGQSES